MKFFCKAALRKVENHIVKLEKNIDDLTVVFFNDIECDAAAQRHVAELRDEVLQLKSRFATQARAELLGESSLDKPSREVHLYRGR